MSEERPRLFLIDGNAYIFRAFYAVPALDGPSKLPANAILGFIHILLKFLKQYKPRYVAVALDAGRDTFRRQIFSAYKNNRRELPAELVPQLPYFRRVLDALNLPQLEQAGYEADDIIATLCHAMRAQNCDLVVVSSDKDLMQLVADRIMLLDSFKDRWIGAAEVKARFGVEPDKIIQVMGLTGDPVDNIPGVKGIGEKTAIALIRQFENLENLYRRLEEVETLALRGAARVRKILEDGKHAAFVSRDLATLRRDVPLSARLEDLRYIGFDRDKLRRLFAELNFDNLLILLDHGRL